ncbi:MAG: ABC transporter ATP-binding protein, partial [Anaerolineales bacterium]|nr:ABC transporter ATP-binding protein [Anaerolineales bacterium]
MAEIQLRDVSYYYPAPLRDPVSRIFRFHKERHQEEPPVETSKGVVALDRVNLTIPDGQTFVVVGPSGCGKSTLLRVVAGIMNDYSGQVLYDGEDVQNIPPGERYIGM